jgi:sugar O-acyltransferase (sialic acid O-acetyltransferase NeuD family)
MANHPEPQGDFKTGSGVEEIIVIGGGGHAKVVIAILHKIASYRIVGYTDREDRGSILGTAYVGTDARLSSQFADRKKLNAIIAVGQVGLGESRYGVWERVKSSFFSFPMVISPDAVVNEGVVGGEGSVVMDGAVVNSGATIGYGAIINTNSTIEHDVELSDWVHVAPGATISGGARVGRFSMIGAGATVIEGRKIADRCVVGAGATVVNDLREPGIYVGCPARRLK